MRGGVSMLEPDIDVWNQLNISAIDTQPLCCHYNLALAVAQMFKTGLPDWRDIERVNMSQECNAGLKTILSKPVRFRLF